MLKAMVTLQLVIMVMILITMITKTMMMVVVPVTMKFAEVLLVLLVVAIAMARNSAYLSENTDGNGIAVELDSDHELVATAEDHSEETILVSNTFPLSVHQEVENLINKQRSGAQQSFALQNLSYYW